MSDVKHRMQMDGDNLVVSHSQDVSQYLDRNKARYDETPEFGKHKGEFNEIANIPNSVYYIWRKKHNFDLLAPMGPTEVRKLRRLLNDPEYRYLRSWNSKV